ncbi:MAG: hypothetical protein HFI00_04630 [Lachnospiraceae bacterium]|jgi:hypothetical protein|nr:hypothetical protein [Lachnospiraceae bacterium]
MNFKKREKGDKKNNTVVIAAALLLFLVIAGGMIYRQIQGHQVKEAWAERLERGEERRARKAAEAEEAMAESEGVLDFSMESGMDVLEAVDGRPLEVELTEETAEDFLKIESCLVNNATSNVLLKATAEGIPASDDDFYYLIASRIQYDDISQGAAIKSVFKGEKIEFQFSRHFGTINGFLYKYSIAIKKDGEYLPVCKPQYITNPGEVSAYKSNGEKMPTKKGLLIDPNKLLSSEIDDLGIRHAAYNIPISRVLGKTTSEEYPTIEYGYQGKAYEFNGEAISEYDLIFSTLTDKEIEITVILLNDIAQGYPQMVHPLARDGIGDAPYYAFNASEEDGIECLAAVSSFLSERYSGRANGRGVISNWVIGNEINARESWNYMQYTDVKTYVREYVKAFRVCYNIIKSRNAASRIYISLDQRWDSNAGGTGSYDGKDILDEFNKQIKEGGNIEWGLAIHPYNVPLTSPYIWNESRYVKNSVDTAMVTMANFHVVTDYLEQEEFLMEDGEVRSVTLSELGYTSSDGEDIQAAALVYAYKVAEANAHVDAVLFSRQTDAVEELEQELALGLNNLDGSHKYAYNVFRYMDTKQQEEYTDFAKDIIGIKSWGEVTERRRVAQ